jgi:uncharacterized protein YndB with AHSA1/START domain
MIQRDIRIKWFFAHPPEKVWAYLTEPELLGEWLMKNDFKPVVGHRFNFYTTPIPNMKFDGIVYCEVLEIIPMQKLIYTWRGGPAPGVVTLDTLLTWTIQTKAGGTEVLLQQTGFKGFSNYIASIFMGSGWKGKIFKRLETLLNG